MTKHLIIIISLISFCTLANAEIISIDMYGKIIEIAMDNFWGKARLKDGSVVQPDSEAERTTLPITREDAEKVIRAGEISSVADWCGLNWQQNYLRITKSARKSGLSGKQVAFVGLLHGVAMGRVDSAVIGKKCSHSVRENTSEQLKNTSNKLIKFTP